MSALPTGWAEVELKEVWRESRARVRPEKIGPTKYIGLEHVEGSTNRITGHRCSKGVKSTAAVFSSGDVLYGRLRPYLNKVVCPHESGIASTEFLVFEESTALTNTLLMHLLSSSDFVAYASANSAGVNLPRVSAQRLGKYRFGLAPLSEQHRIVSKIESLFAKLDEGVAALKRAEGNLERYRTSILKSAVEGRLTEQWRGENPPEENGEQLLQRILSERRKHWEEEQLAKFAVKGRKPPKDWKAKYKEPVFPNTTGLPRLPEGWCWATVDQLTDSLANGIYKPAKFYSSNGIPCLRMYNIVDGELVLRDLKRMMLTEDELDQYGLKKGDLLINRVNSRELVGKAAAIPDGLGRIVFESKNIRLRPVGMGYETRFLGYCFAVLAPAYFGRHSQQVVGMASISQQQVRQLVVPVPPSSEQRGIVTRVDRLKQSSEQLELTIRAKRKTSRALRQSILKRAFEGELVPQDPGDEPASVLLDRMRTALKVKRHPKNRQPSKQGRRLKSRVP